MSKNYEALAIKYRPRRFDDLIGQDTIAQTLSLALDSKRLSHAYLFSGLRGSGKTSTARIFAKALQCKKGPTSQPCEQCEHCEMANEGRHIDIIEMDAASSRRIDDIRDLIEQTKYKPALAAFKIFIIDEVHMLTKEAFNALLKTLEEPPPYIKFILATTDPLKLPATILSRTQHFRFKKIARPYAVAHLEHILNHESITFETDALQMLARSGAGSLRDTLTLLDQAIIYSKHHVDVATVSGMLGLIDPEFFNTLFAIIFARDRTALTEQLKELETYEAQMVVDELTEWLKERMFEGDSRFNTLLLERFFRILSEAKSLFALGAESSFVLGLIFFKMIEALSVKEIDQMIESLEAQLQGPQSQPAAQTTAAVTPAPVPKAPPAPASAQGSGEAKFEQLCRRIEDRNAEAGACFRQQVFYVAYADNVLTWESCATGECKDLLRHAYSVIQQLAREVYGFETRIKHQPCSRPEPQSPPPAAAEPTPPVVAPAAPVTEEEPPQTGSTTEMIETGGGSCVEGCGPSSTDAAKEIDGNEILNDPMVRRAAELFEPTKITIQNKV